MPTVAKHGVPDTAEPPLPPQCAYITKKKLGGEEHRCTEPAIVVNNPLCTNINNMCMAHMFEMALVVKGHTHKKPQAPRTKPNAWTEFQKENRASVRRDNPGMTVQEVTKRLGAMWQEHNRPFREFCEQHRALVKSENPGITDKDLTKELAARFQSHKEHHPKRDISGLSTPSGESNKKYTNKVRVAHKPNTSFNQPQMRDYEPFHHPAGDGGGDGDQHERHVRPRQSDPVNIPFGGHYPVNMDSDSE